MKLTTQNSPKKIVCRHRLKVPQVVESVIL